jgi:hypothetical protein
MKQAAMGYEPERVKEVVGTVTEDNRRIGPYPLYLLDTFFAALVAGLPC